MPNKKQQTKRRNSRPDGPTTARASAKVAFEKWFVYLLRCADDSLYTGIAKDLTRRCRQHNAGTASRYTRCRLPVALAYQEVHRGRSAALKREAAIKSMSKQAKEAMLDGVLLAESRATRHNGS
jgi:predicted GIY-YIG superfamily endonuclease